jgi:hypothetical protein
VFGPIGAFGLLPHSLVAFTASEATTQVAGQPIPLQFHQAMFTLRRFAVQRLPGAGRTAAGRLPAVRCEEAPGLGPPRVQLHHLCVRPDGERQVIHHVRQGGGELRSVIYSFILYHNLFYRTPPRMHPNKSFLFAPFAWEQSPWAQRPASVGLGVQAKFAR